MIKAKPTSWRLEATGYRNIWATVGLNAGRSFLSASPRVSLGIHCNSSMEALCMFMSWKGSSLSCTFVFTSCENTSNERVLIRFRWNGLSACVGYFSIYVSFFSWPLVCQSAVQLCSDYQLGEMQGHLWVKQRKRMGVAVWPFWSH